MDLDAQHDVSRHGGWVELRNFLTQRRLSIGTTHSRIRLRLSACCLANCQGWEHGAYPMIESPRLSCLYPTIQRRTVVQLIETLRHSPIL